MKVFVDKSELLSTKGITGQYGLVHEGKLINSTYVNDLQVTRRGAATHPTGRIQMYSTASGVFALCTQNSNTEWALYRSPDGVTAYTEVLRGTAGYASGYQTALVDCGNDRLIFFEYADSDETNEIYYSADGGLNWGDNSPDFDDGDPIITAEIGSIRHFHGGKWDADYNRLYVFTGDHGNHASILFCSDIDDLVTNPDTWKNRWGLADNTRSTLDDNYVVGRNDQVWRCLDMGVSGDWMYHGGDTLSGGQDVACFHRETHEKRDVYVHTHSTAVSPGEACGEVWAWGNAPDGTLLMMGSGAGSANPGADGYFHLYALEGREGTVMREIHAVEKDGGHADSGVAIPHGIYAYDDYVLILNRLRMPHVLGKVVTAGGLPLMRPEYDEDEQAAFYYGPDPTAVGVSYGASSNVEEWVIRGTKIDLPAGRHQLGRFYSRLGYTGPSDVDQTYIAVGSLVDGKLNIIETVGGEKFWDATTDLATSGGTSSRLTYPVDFAYDFEAGIDYYVCIYFHRTATAGLNRPLMLRMNAAQGPQGDWFGLNVPGTRPESDIDVTLSTSSQPMLNTNWSSSERRLISIDNPTIGEPVTIPSTRDHDFFIKLSDVVVEAGNSLTIELMNVSSGDENALHTIVLDMGATDQVTVDGTGVALNAATPEAGDTFDIGIVYRDSSEKFNVVWRNKSVGQGLSSDDYITIAHGAADTGRGTEYDISSRVYMAKLSGTATVGKLEVGWEPLIMIGDENVEQLAAHLPIAMTRNRIVWEDWAPGSKWTASTADLTAGYLRYKHGTPGSGDVCEIATGLLVLCGPGVHDLAGIVDEDVNADRLELATDYITRTAEVIQDWNTHANTTVHSGVMVVGLPPYSATAARHSQVQAIREQLNPALEGLAFAAGAAYVNPYHLLSSGAQQKPTFRGSSDGITYASDEAQLVASGIARTYESNAIGSWWANPARRYGRKNGRLTPI